MAKRRNGRLRRPAVFLLGLLLMALSMTPTIEAAILNATLIEDTYISSDSTESNTNFSASSTLNFRTHTAVWRNPLIQFDLPALPAGEQVVQADLILSSAQNPSGTGGTPDIEVLGTTTAIDMSTVTFNSATPSLHTGGEAGTSALLWTAVWDDFSVESVVPGADFGVGEVVNYSDADAAAGMLKFIKDNISGSGPVTVNFGLGFVIREGNDGTTSLGWQVHSSQGSGSAPMLRITTAPIPEPASIGLAALGGLLMFGRRRTPTGANRRTVG